MSDIALYTARPCARVTAAAAPYTALADHLVFPSAGRVRRLLRLRGEIASRTVPVAIGPIAAAGLAAHGVPNALVPPQIGRAHIVSALLELHRGR